MTYLFISDLHLSPDHPRLVRGFFALLRHYQDQHTQLYILGDWFNVWIGDDDHSPWLEDIVTALQNFHAAGNQVHFLAGNRDFALGQRFLNRFSGTLLKDTSFLNIAGYHIRIEHGDSLCTDDIAYQRFKKIIRHPVILTLLKHSPLLFRRYLAAGFRQKSHKATRHKHAYIMDVNAAAVMDAMQSVDLLIHGHTHRPARHQVARHKERIVLGDWRENPDHAVCLEIKNGQLRFFDALHEHPDKM